MQNRLQICPRWIVGLSFALLVVSVISTDVRAQEQRQSNKPAVVDAAARVNMAAPDRESEIRGVTYVSVPPVLKGILGGRDPRSVAELRALEKQQSSVAKAIDAVTVNVQQGSAQGSGVIVSGDGYVLTAAHVAGDANLDAWVLLSNGRRLRARTLGLNKDKDAGMLKIIESSDEPWPHATLGTSSELNEGQWVVAAGHPGGWQAERGSVIRVGRVLEIRGGGRGNKRAVGAHTLFSDCALIGGDSGGPLFTLDGKLVGVHSRIGTDVQENMHVPIDVFYESVDRMKKGEVWGTLPGYESAAPQQPSPKTSPKQTRTPIIGVNGTEGRGDPLIASVTENGPAHLAGVQAGDLILQVDYRPITRFDQLKRAVRAKRPGDIILLTVRRGSQTLRLPVTIDYRR